MEAPRVQRRRGATSSRDQHTASKQPHLPHAQLRCQGHSHMNPAAGTGHGRPLAPQLLPRAAPRLLDARARPLPSPRLLLRPACPSRKLRIRQVRAGSSALRPAATGRHPRRRPPSQIPSPRRTSARLARRPRRPRTTGTAAERPPQRGDAGAGDLGRLHHRAWSPARPRVRGTQRPRRRPLKELRGLPAAPSGDFLSSPV
ncbi:hypothetical protein PVAP13_6KG010401 [Panicum virgatum]|uniref:Uncharacterized protein n=1 Tax=Panicum virgatum TaxID=38727 RepID=A0A8T0R804_PANVG|nr:hypothetical protein PVAP13_6KG010401 [Panicum virgatum]